MSSLTARSLRLLRLPVRKRVVLVVGALVVSLGLSGQALSATALGSLLLSLILSAWLLGWRGGLLCAAGVTLLLGVC